MPNRARLLIGALRFSLAGCALFLVLVALYVSLGRQLTPLAGDYQQEVTDALRHQLGVPVVIDELKGEWYRFSPVLAIKGVRIGDDKQAVMLDQVRLIPSLWESLVHWQLRLSTVEIDGAGLVLREQADGGWHLDGMKHGGEWPDIEGTLRRLLDIHHIQIIESQLTLLPYQGDSIVLDHLEILLENGSRQLAGGRVRLPNGQPVSFAANLKIKPSNWRQSEFKGYLNLPQIDWAHWLPARLIAQWQVETLSAGGDLWWDWRKEQLQSVVARVHAPLIRAAHVDREPVTLNNLGMNLFFDRQQDGWRIRIADLAASSGEKRWGETEMEVQYRLQEGEPQWQVRADQLDIEPLSAVAQSLSPMPPVVHEWLAGLQPTGVLSNVSLRLWPNRPLPDRAEISANLEKLSLRPYHQVPGIENVDGTVQGSLRGGTLDVSAQQFGLHLAMLFPEAWHYRRAGGRLFWQFDEETFTLGSHLMRIEGEEGQLAGDMLIRLARDETREDYMDLRVSLRDGDAGFTSRYLPTVLKEMPKALAEWLGGAILGGRVKEGYFQWQGALGHTESAAAHVMSMYFNVDDGSLDYEKDWPALSAVNGEVFVQGHHVWVEADSGKILNSTVRNVRVDIPAVEHHDDLHIRVQGDVESNLNDTLYTLQHAPIPTQELLSGWTGSGSVQGRLQLDIPLGAQHDKTGVVVDFSTPDAQLTLPQQNLRLTGIKGDFHFDLDKGLSAPTVQAQVMGTTVRGKIVAEGHHDVRTRFLMEGRVDIETLVEWGGLSRHSVPAKGKTAFHLDLLLDGDNSLLQVDSALQGVTVDLPAPFAKAAEESLPSMWRMTLGGTEQHIEGEYGKRARLVYAAPSHRLFSGRGELLIGGGQASLPSTKGLVIKGHMKRLDLADWQSTMDRYQRGMAVGSGYSHTLASGTMAELLRYALLKIDVFHGFGQDLKQLTVDLQRQENAWQMNFHADRLGGQAVLSDTQGYPILLNLEWLSLPKPVAADVVSPTRPDVLSNIDSNSLPPINLTIANIALDDESLGSWRFDIRPQGNSVSLENIHIDMRGLQINGRAVWEGSGHSKQTHYRGQLYGGDLAKVLKAWDYAPSVSSERFRLDVDGNWPGSPWEPDLRQFTGSLDASIRKGQFSEVEGGAQALRVFGLLNFNSIGRRLRLDFSDLLDKGLAYDTLKGVLQAKEGVYVTHEPIRLKGPSSNLELNGTFDMVDDRIDAKLLVTLPITNNLPLAALIVGAPAVGGALFVADKLLGNQVARFATVQYDVTGSWQDPQISFDRPFEKPQ